MKLLILGGTGVISSAIVGQGLAQGHEITVVNRGSRVSPFAGQIRCIQADRMYTAAFAAKMDKVRADVVIDMISFNPDDAEQTVRLFRDKDALRLRITIGPKDLMERVLYQLKRALME